MKKLSIFCGVPLLLTMAFYSGTLHAKGDALTSIVNDVQRVYEKTSTFKARFTQRYTHVALSRTQENAGTVTFMKPGKMRWDYTGASPKSFIVTGSELWIYQPNDKLAFVDRCFKEDGLTASVSFLWGKGKLTDEFNVAWFAGILASPLDLHLELTPKKPNSIFEKMVLIVDPISHEVHRTVIIDLQGNYNEFSFEDVDRSAKVSAKDFDAKAAMAESTTVSPIPGSCSKPESDTK